jgi:hypothetical protein
MNGDLETGGGRRDRVFVQNALVEKRRNHENERLYAVKNEMDDEWWKQ